MQVRMKTKMAGPEDNHAVGAVVEFPAKVAKSLIDGGYAEEYVEPEEETAVVKPEEETADAPPKRTRRARRSKPYIDKVPDNESDEGPNDALDTDG